MIIFIIIITAFSGRVFPISAVPTHVVFPIATIVIFLTALTVTVVLVVIISKRCKLKVSVI